MILKKGDYAMEIKRVMMTNELQNKKTGKKFYIQVVEMGDSSESFQLKIMCNVPVSEGDNVALPYLMTDYQNYGVKVEVA